MFKTFSLALFAFAFPAFIQAQETAGFSFVNCLPDTAWIRAGTMDLLPGGIESGLASSGLGLTPGSYPLTVTSTNLEPGKASITLKVGSSPIIIAYAEQRVDEETGKIARAIAFHQPTSKPQEGKFLISFLSVTRRDPLSLKINGEDVALERFKPQTFEGKAWSVSTSSGAAIDEGEVEEPRHCFVVVFDGAAPDELRTAFADDIVYVW